MRRELATSILVLATTIVHAQTDAPAPEVPEKTRYSHNLGFAAGFSTGYGLSYRFTPNRFGLQATFAPYTDSDQTRISAGLTFLYFLFQAGKSALFLYQGNHVMHRSYDAYVSYGSPAERMHETESVHGLGIGMEFIFGQRVGLNLMGGYALYDDPEGIGFTGEAGLYYKF